MLREVLAISFAVQIVLASIGRTLAAEASVPEAPKREVTIRREEGKTVAENAFLSVEFSTADKKLKTLSVTNRVTGVSTTLTGEDFVFVFQPVGEEEGRTVRSSEFSLERDFDESVGAGGKRLVFELSRSELRVRACWELTPEDWWATRWVEIHKGAGRLSKISLCEWRVLGSYGPPGPGRTVEGLGCASGLGQVAYVEDLFFGILHPAAENFARGKRISARISAFDELQEGKIFATPRFIVGAGEPGGAAQSFLRWLAKARANPPRSAILLRAGNPDRAVSAFETARELKSGGGLPIAAILLEGAREFPGAAGGAAIALRLTPAGLGLEGTQTVLCPAAVKTSKPLVETVLSWLSKGAVSIELDGFFPNCQVGEHAHPTGAGSEPAQIDALLGAIGVWRAVRRDALFSHLRGSNPSPFWLLYVDFVSPGGEERAEAAPGASESASQAGDELLERFATAIDEKLQAHRVTEMPISAFAVDDLDGGLASRASDGAFERYAWWLVARTTLRHRWDVRASDLSEERWKTLAAAFRWGASHERVFGSSRMVGGDPRRGSIYGFSAMDGGAGVLSLRNPSSEPASLERQLSSLLALSRAAAKKTYRLRGVYGHTKGLEGSWEGRATLKVELPPYGVAVLEVSQD